MKRLTVISAIIFLLGNVSLAQHLLPSTNFLDCNFMPVGHRGYPSVFPENSLRSLEELFKRGIKFAEVDVSVTKDGVYVLFHDSPSIFRTTNGTGKLADKTYAELKQLDIGSWKGEEFKNERIGTLVEALRIAEKYDAQLYLDTKSYDLPKLKAALLESGVATKLLGKFIPEKLKIIRL